MKTNILILVAVVLAFTACKKSPPSTIARQTQYTLIQENNSGIAGTVTFVEVADSSKTQVDIEVSNTHFYEYSAHIHSGPPSAYRGAVYGFYQLYAHDGHLSFKQNIPLLYDSALTYNGTFVFHDSTTNNVLALCGIGANK